VKGRPISLGFNLFYNKYQFLGQGFGSTQTVDDLYTSYGGQSLFTQKTLGGSVSLSAPLSHFARRFRMGRFIRLGLQYTYSTTDIEDPAVNRDEDTGNDIIVTFRQSGVRQSTLTPTISYSTLNSSLDPTSGKSLTLGASLSGSILGGDVNTIAPYVEFKFFRPLLAGREATALPDPRKTRTFGMRALFGHTSAYGALFDSNSASFIGGTPLSSRFYLGGEDSIRGYNVRSIAPLIPLERTVNTRNVYVTDQDGNRLKVREGNRATSNTVAPSVIQTFTQSNVAVSDTSYVPLGSDSQLLLNFEYRIPLLGPVTFAPFLDVGSAFNLRKLEDQFIYSEYVPTKLNSGLALILNQTGTMATDRQLKRFGLPEGSGAVLPPGFRYAYIYGEQQTNTKLTLSQSLGGLFENYRYSLGGELRVQVPVINVPFRLILAWNPNARVNNPYVFEETRAIRFSIGRTF
jgi:outer membrane protein insertion porin family